MGTPCKAEANLAAPQRLQLRLSAHSGHARGMAVLPRKAQGRNDKMTVHVVAVLPVLV